MVRAMTDQGGAGRPRSRGRQAAILVVGATLAVIAAMFVVGIARYAMHGPPGASRDPGAEVSNKPLAELPSDPNRWVNGAPVSLAAARDKVLLVEAWHPA